MEDLAVGASRHGPGGVHTLGDAADDWAAIDVWLGAVSANLRAVAAQRS